MPLTPDDLQGGISDADLLLLRDAGVNPAAIGEVRRNGNDLLAYDGAGLFNLRGSGGISAAQHKALRDLIHFLDDGPGDGFASGAVRDTNYTGAFPTTETWWEDATRTQRIVQLDTTYTGAFPTTETWRVYDTDGATVLVTLVDAITYTGAFEASRTRTWS